MVKSSNTNIVTRFTGIMMTTLWILGCNMPNYWIYLIYTVTLALIMIAVVPREVIRRLAMPALMAGGISDIGLVLLLNAIHAGHYKDFGPFGFLEIPFFPPIAWTIFYIIYLYFLPIRSSLVYLYALVAAGYSILFANVLVNLGILWFSHRVLVPVLIYPLWFLLITYFYLKLTDNEGLVTAPTD
jgi:hypothetical protein